MNSNVASSPTVAVVTLDHWYEAPFEVSDSDVQSMDPTFFPMQASEAIKSLANDADQFILALHTGFYGASGVAGTTFSTVGTPTGARKLLNKQLAPLDQRFGILDPEAENAFLSLSNVIQADQRGDQGGILQGSVGTKFGIDWYMNQNVQSFTPGTAWVTGWSVATGGATAGNSTTTVINATASGTVKVGDIFTVSGGTQQYVITTAIAAVTSSSGAGVNTAINFYPSLATTVVSGAALTVVSTAYTANLVLNKYAIAFASRPFRDTLVDGHVFQAPLDPVSGIALRLEISRQYKLETLSYDYIAGANVVRRELGVKLFG
jgi:hypothetical protein